MTTKSQELNLRIVRAYWPMILTIVGGIWGFFDLHAAAQSNEVQIQANAIRLDALESMASKAAVDSAHRESDVQHLKSSLQEVKTDVKDLRVEQTAGFRRIETLLRDRSSE